MGPKVRTFYNKSVSDSYKNSILCKQHRDHTHLFRLWPFQECPSASRLDTDRGCRLPLLCQAMQGKCSLLLTGFIVPWHRCHGLGHVAGASVALVAEQQRVSRVDLGGIDRRARLYLS